MTNASHHMNQQVNERGAVLLATLLIMSVMAVLAIIMVEDILLAVDNTFATPYNQIPLDLGADVVMHSVTKYLGGHSDTVMGALICKDDSLASELFRIQNSSGAVPGPQEYCISCQQKPLTPPHQIHRARVNHLSLHQQ